MVKFLERLEVDLSNHGTLHIHKTKRSRRKDFENKQGETSEEGLEEREPSVVRNAPTGTWQHSFCISLKVMI